MNTLKSIAALMLLFTMSCSASFGQSFQLGDKHLNLGIGFGGGLGIPIGLSYEQGVTNRISVGGYLAFATDKQSWGSAGQWKYTYILAAARGSYHLPVNSEKFDPYGGVMLGYNVSSVKWDGSGSEPLSSSAGGLLLGVHIGSRYWLTDKLGAFAEIGYGAGVLNVGVAIKL